MLFVMGSKSAHVLKRTYAILLVLTGMVQWHSNKWGLPSMTTVVFFLLAHPPSATGAACEGKTTWHHVAQCGGARVRRWAARFALVEVVS